MPASNTQNLGEYYSKGSPPHPKILNILEHLTKDRRNTIFIITGRESKLVSSWFSCIFISKKLLFTYCYIKDYSLGLAISKIKYYKNLNTKKSIKIKVSQN